MGRKPQPARVKRDYAAVDKVMIRDDVAWVSSITLSVADTSWEGTVGVVLAPHVARVVHEALAQLDRVKPLAASELRRRLSDDVARARHSLKLVDDNQRSIDDLLAGFAHIAAKHGLRFPFGADATIATWNGGPLTTSRAAEFQSLATVDRHDVRAFAESITSTMVRIARDGFGITLAATDALTFPDDDATWLDVVADEAYPSLYDGALQPAEADLLLTAEGALRSTSLLAHVSQTTHPAPVFRASLVALVHAASAIDAIDARHPSVVPAAVLAALRDDPVAWLRDQRALRNRAMHYGVPGHLTGIAASAPMYGLVEATTSRPYAEVRTELAAGSGTLADALADWRGQIHGRVIEHDD